MYEGCEAVVPSLYYDSAKGLPTIVQMLYKDYA